MSFELTPFGAALAAADEYVSKAQAVTLELTSIDGKVDAGLIEKHQRIVHGYAWLKSSTTALHSLLAWAERLQASAQLGKVEQLSLDIAFGELLSQLIGGVAMGQNESVRPSDFALFDESVHLAKNESVHYFLCSGNTASKRRALA